MITIIVVVAVIPATVGINLLIIIPYIIIILINNNILFFPRNQIPLQTTKQLFHPQTILRTRPIHQRIHRNLTLSRMNQRMIPHAQLICQSNAVGTTAPVDFGQYKGVRDGIVIAPSHDCEIYGCRLGKARVKEEVELFERRCVSVFVDGWIVYLVKVRVSVSITPTTLFRPRLQSTLFLLLHFIAILTLLLGSHHRKRSPRNQKLLCLCLPLIHRLIRSRSIPKPRKIHQKHPRPPRIGMLPQLLRILKRRQMDHRSGRRRHKTIRDQSKVIDGLGPSGSFGGASQFSSAAGYVLGGSSTRSEDGRGESVDEGGFSGVASSEEGYFGRAIGRGFVVGEGGGGEVVEVG
mmetsp:Transcript_10623/g.22213  ORF Transcript_10623/g.22213 Transcript_10623/m.22213 type:complete len:349 (-) Transcript_10623:964-2010(-)